MSGFCVSPSSSFPLFPLVSQGSLQEHNYRTTLSVQRGGYQSGLQLWSCYSNNGCLPIKSPRIQQLLRTRGWRPPLDVFSVCRNLREVGPKVSEGMHVSARVRASGERGRKRVRECVCMCVFPSSMSLCSPDQRWTFPSQKIWTESGSSHFELSN